MKQLQTLQLWLLAMKNKYILEVKFIDTLNRCRKSTIVGVYSKPSDVEIAKENFAHKEHKYRPIFSVAIENDLFTLDNA